MVEGRKAVIEDRPPHMGQPSPIAIRKKQTSPAIDTSLLGDARKAGGLARTITSLPLPEAALNPLARLHTRVFAKKVPTRNRGKSRTLGSASEATCRRKICKDIPPNKREHSKPTRVVSAQEACHASIDS
jgi:hypothetical protein